MYKSIFQVDGLEKLEKLANALKSADPSILHHRLEGSEVGHGIERIDEEGRIWWWQNVKAMRAGGDVFDIDAFRRMVRSCDPFKKLIQGRPGCRQESKFSPHFSTSQKERTISIFVEGNTSMKGRNFETAFEVTRSRRKLGKGVTLHAYRTSGRLQQLSMESVSSSGLACRTLRMRGMNTGSVWIPLMNSRCLRPLNIPVDQNGTLQS